MNKPDGYDKWRLQRQSGEKSDKKGEKKEYRSEFERDRDRILYSTAFQRLNGITQVTAVGEVHLLHNRMSHSLRVGQIGRRLAEKLIKSSKKELVDQIYIDPDVVESAGLAHDLGHPPFGHIGEEKLNELLEEYGGFEGNAQTFRIVTKLERHKPELQYGLDLTNATLNAVLKYPCRLKKKATEGSYRDIYWGGQQMKGVYESEKDIFRKVRKNGRLAEGVRTPEAVMVDIADDLAYVLHDVEDFYRTGLVPLHKLYTHPVLGEDFISYAKRRVKGKLGYSHKDDEAFEVIFRSAYEYLMNRLKVFEHPYRGLAIDDGNIQDFTTNILISATNAIDIKVGPDKLPYITMDESIRCTVAIIRELTWFYVINRPSLAVMQNGQRQILEVVFNRLVDLIIPENGKATGQTYRDSVIHVPPGIPTRLKVILDLLSDDDGDTDHADNYNNTRHRHYFQYRAVADFICTLTEAQVIDLYKRFTGQSQHSMFGTWFQ